MTNFSLKNVSFATPDYRFGFNGMLRDDDVRDEKGTVSDNEGRGNSYDFGARILDPRVGRWLSLDPLMSKYPSVSSYNFTLNNPVNYIDPDGRVTTPALDKIRDDVLESYNSILGSATSEDTRRLIENEISLFNQGYTKLQESRITYDMGRFDADGLMTKIEGGRVYYSINESSVKMNLRHKAKVGGSLEFSANARHEFEHMFQFELGKNSFDKSGLHGGLLYDQMDEVEAFDAMKVFGFGLNAYEIIDNEVRLNGYQIPNIPFPIINDEGEIIGLENRSMYNYKNGDIEAAKEELNRKENIYNKNIESTPNE